MRAANPPEMAGIPEPVTTTVAGSGERGIADGPADAATFMTPQSVAIAPDGALIVADPAAQDVRRIADGAVTTLAGAAPEGATPDERAGGFQDGPARQARFDRPVAVAVGRNGDVFVADAGNRCVRRIANGVVSTFSGSRAPGHADGDGRIAQFEDIRGLAIDDAGALYVADGGVGIRRVDPNGDVTTLALPIDTKDVRAVAVHGAGDRTILAFTDAKELHVRERGKTIDVAYTDDREPSAPGMVVGRVTGVAIVSDRLLAITDAATNAVRLLRLPAPPFLTDRMARSLAGGVRESEDLRGGFADGTSDVAEVADPAGIARARDGTFYVADAGNRRIRAIHGVDTRQPVYPDASNFPDMRKGYRIAVIGNSYAFYNVLWPESIPGRIEARLARDAKTIGLPARPAVAVFRVDDLSASAAKSLVREYLGDGQVDLVILLVNAYDAWTGDDFDALAAQLQTEHAQLMLVYTPQGYEVSPLDFPAGLANRDADFAAAHAAAVRSESYYHHENVQSVLLLDQMEAWEGRKDRIPLFYATDHHFTIFGSAWVGDRIGEALENWAPWRP